MADWTEHLRPRLALLRLSPGREAEIIEELSQHLDERYEELRAHGATDDEARRAALEELREPEALADQMRTLRQSRVPAPVTPGAPKVSVLADLRQDWRYAIRAFLKQPGFAAAVVLTLAIGIGATTGMFAVVHGVILRPLAFEESDRIIALYHNGRLGTERAVMNHGPATYFTYRDNQQAFEDIGGWDRTDVAITGPGEPERVPALAVTEATLRLLRVTPARGRFFSPEDDRPGSPLTVVLTHGYWQRRFGGGLDVIGQPLEIGGETATVIGVLPPSFSFPRSDPALLLPMQPDRANATGASFGFQVIGRLKPGVTVAEATADVARMIPLVEEVPGHAPFELQPNLYPLVEYASEDVRGTLWILFGMMGIVLLIACANVANLFLVRVEGRQRELAVRSVLGANRGRLVRELLAESLLLGLMGGAMGLVLAAAGTGLLRRTAAETLPRVAEIGIELQVLLFTLLVSVLTSLLFGLIPVLRLGTPTGASLKEGGRTASEGPSRLRSRNTLAVAQIAMAFVMLIASGLMVRTFVAMRQVAPGFVAPEQVQTFRVEVPEAFWDDEAEMVRIHERILERLRQVPGVVSVGVSSSVTMDGEDNLNPLFVERDPPCEDECWQFWRFKTVAPGYFETMGNPLVAGRGITWTDVYEARPVLVVSETLAREVWGGPLEALGKRARAFNPDEPWREIVGVVGDERDDGLNQPATGIVYWPLLNEGFTESTLAYTVRSDRVGTPGFLGELRDAVWSVNASLPLSNVLTLDEILGASMTSTSFAMVLLAIAAGVALLLGVVGIYGVIAYVAAQRTREIGIRIALGARVADVRQMFLRYGLSLTVVGIALGTGGALALTRTMASMLFGVSPLDIATYAAVAAMLAVVALIASNLPARRASRVDPIVALRGEG